MNRVLIEIDAGACIGYGECVAAEPEAVALGDDGCAHVLRAALDARRAQRLCDACPAAAIRIAS